MLFIKKLAPKGGLFSALIGLTSLVAMAVASTNGPVCKDECNKNFNGDSLIEHPGVQSICHRGCELFTVAFIATPRGGVPLVEPKPGVIPPAIMATLDKYGIPLGPANFPIIKKTALNQKSKDTKPVIVHDKNEKEREELEKSINKRIDNEDERLNVKRLISGENEPKEIKEIHVTHDAPKAPVKVEDKKELHKSESKHVVHDDIFDIENCPELTEAEIADFKKQIAVQSVPANGQTDKKHNDKHAVNQKTIAGENKPKKSFREEVFSQIKKDSQSKTPKKMHFEKTFKGDEARAILNAVRTHEAHNVQNSLHHASSNIPHGPEKKTDLKGKVAKAPNSPSSKTTVQPLPLPVQDHPVHANRQITTDSSGTDDRKTTTPKSSNPAVPVPLNRIKQIHEVNKLGSKLGANKSNLIHPLLHITFLKPRPRVQLMVPQQVSIIEIVKKKNNIDFEKLHQEHMEGAAMCPEINERLEQAKHSCRHACVTAFSVAQEQDACVVGCHIRASSSVKQVEEQRVLAKRPPKLLSFDNSVQNFNDGVFSSIFDMISAMSQSFGVKTAQDFLMSPARASKEHANRMISAIEKSGSVSTDAAGHQIINSKTVVHLNSPNTPQRRTEEKVEQDYGFEPIAADPKGGLFKHSLEKFENEHKEVDLLNKEIEIMGFHLNEKPKESPQLQLPKFIRDIMTGHGFEPILKFPNKPDWRGNSNKMDQPTIIKTFVTSDVKDGDGPPAESNFAKTFSRIVDESESMNLKQLQQPIITVKQLQQLDLLECISRKSGLPRWVIGMTIFASALLVVWLCFSLYSPVEESKFCKKKVPPTVVLCDGDHPHDCEEEKQLLPPEDCIKIRFQDV